MRRLSWVAGFSVVELLVVIIIMGILAGLGVPMYLNSLKDRTLQEYGANMEYQIRSARLLAMERTKNVGICRSSATQLIIYDMGTDRGASQCSGTQASAMTISASHNTNYGISLSGSGGAIDPRGLAIWTGNVCVSNGAKYIKVIINRVGLRTQEGSGGCT